MEIIIVIVIIAVIMMLIGGLGPTGLVYETNYAALEASKWNCDKIVWTQPATVENGEFRGRLELACEVEGIGAGGIAALEDYLSDRVVAKAAKFYGASYGVSEGSMTGASYDVAVHGEQDGDSIDLRGTSRIVSDGAVELRHSFSADRQEAQKASRWLRGVGSTLYVTATLRPNWYRVVLAHEATIAKPALVSSSRFRSMVAEKLEAKVNEQAKSLLTSVANHL